MDESEHTENFTDLGDLEYIDILADPGAEYTDIFTDAGTIRIIHEITLGDMAIFVVLALMLSFQFVKWIINKIWS